jgi:formylglycine-generating enzyme required for sulfatase activity
VPPTGMVAIATTRMSSSFEIGADGRPLPVVVRGFWLDRYEVDVARYRACVVAGACPTPKAIDTFTTEETSVCNWGAASRERHPMNCVTHAEAAALCRYEGKRLPTEREFEAAASGAAERRFPWGNAAPSTSLLNACDASCAREATHLGLSLESMFDGRTPDDDGFAFTAPVGSFPAGATPEGVLDLAGNVEEWMADLFVEPGQPVGATPAPNPSGAAPLRTVRGGSWDLSTEDVFARGHRNDVSEEIRSAWLGFRCARDD